MELSYKRGYFIMVGLMLGQILFMYFNPPYGSYKPRKIMIVDVDTTTTVIVPEELKEISDNPHRPTKLVGFVYKDTVYINFAPHDDEDGPDSIRTVNNIFKLTSYGSNKR